MIIAKQSRSFAGGDVHAHQQAGHRQHSLALEMRRSRWCRIWKQRGFEVDPETSIGTGYL
jgi:hypothetical protein